MRNPTGGKVAALQSTPVAPWKGGYAWYVLLLLFLANCLNAFDRSIITVLVEPIRKEFGFSDTQLGVLSGLAFSIFYALMGIPIGRWVDRTRRGTVLSIGIALWSGMTAVSGSVTGFTTMLLARMGVGVGEATCHPCSYSLIGDYFPAAKRPFAISIFQTGLFAGIVGGAAGASVLAHHYGWRAAFYIAGAMGLVLALVVHLTLREPARGQQDARADNLASHEPVSVVLRELAGDRAFLLLAIATTFFFMASATMGAWGPAFLMRLHGVSQIQVGLIAGPAMGAGGVLGTLIGGAAGTWLATRQGQQRSALKVPLWWVLPTLPMLCLFIFAPAIGGVVAGGGLAAFFLSSHIGPTLAVALNRVRANRRGLAASLVISGQLLVGYGLGPLIVGLLSDAMAAAAGVQSLRYALLMAPVCALIGWLFLAAGYHTVKRGEETRA